MSKRLVAWANEYKDGTDVYNNKEDALRYDRHYYGAHRVAVRLVECAESETVVSKSELRALRAALKQYLRDHHSTCICASRKFFKAKRRRK